MKATRLVPLPERDGVRLPSPPRSRTSSRPSSSKSSRRPRSSSRPQSSMSQSQTLAVPQTLKLNFASSPVPYFDYHSLSSPNGRSLPSVAMSPSQMKFSWTQSPQPDYRSMGFARLPESIIMRFEDELKFNELLDDDDGGDSLNMLPSLKELTKRSKHALKTQRTGGAGGNSSSDSGTDAHSSQHSSRSKSKSKSKKNNSKHSRRPSAAALPSSNDDAEGGSRPSSRHSQRGNSRPSSSASQRLNGTITEGDENVSDNDSDWSSDDDSDNDSNSNYENSDDDYIDDEIDDDQYYVDPPTPLILSPKSAARMEREFNFAQRPASNSAVTNVHFNSLLSPSNDTASLSMEEVSEVLIEHFTSPSVFGLTGILSPVSMALIKDSLFSNSTTADSDIPLLFPGFPLTSQASVLLQNEGLTMPHIKHLLSLMLVYSTAFQDLVKMMKVSLMDGNDSDDDNDGERKLQRERIFVMTWKLFLFALKKCVHKESDTNSDAGGDSSRTDGSDNKETPRPTNDGPLTQCMTVMRIEADRLATSLRLQHHRSHRLTALKQRETHANDRLIFHHNKLQALAYQYQQSTDEQRSLQSDLDIETRKAKDRSDAKRSRLATFQSWNSRSRQANERKRMLNEDRDAIIKYSVVLESDLQALLARLAQQRNENAEFNQLLQLLLLEVKQCITDKNELLAREQQAEADIALSHTNNHQAEKRVFASEKQMLQLAKKWTNSVRDRVRIHTLLLQYIDSVVSVESQSLMLEQEVSQHEETKELIEEEMVGMKATERELQENLVLEKEHQSQLKIELEQNLQTVTQDTAKLNHLYELLGTILIKHESQKAKLNSVTAVLADHQRRWRESEDRLTLTSQTIESMNSQSVLIDRHNYARMKEIKLMDANKNHLESERSTMRKGVEEFEARKLQRIKAFETRNAAKESECVMMMQELLAEEKKCDELDHAEVKLKNSIEVIEKEILFLFATIEQSKEDKINYARQIEKAREETIQLKENFQKVLSIQKQEVSVLGHLQAAHEKHVVSVTNEIDGIEVQCASVSAEIDRVKAELHELAVARQSIDKFHSEEMARKQEQLTDIVKASMRHEEEFKLFMNDEKAERDVLTKDAEAVTAANLALRGDQKDLRMKIELVHHRTRLALEKQQNLRERIQSMKLANNAHTRVLSTLQENLVVAVNEFYGKSRHQLPARQTLDYVRNVNKDLRLIVAEYEQKELQRNGRANVRHAETQTQPIIVVGR